MQNPRQKFRIWECKKKNAQYIQSLLQYSNKKLFTEDSEMMERSFLMEQKKKSLSFGVFLHSNKRHKHLKFTFEISQTPECNGQQGPPI